MQMEILEKFGLDGRRKKMMLDDLLWWNEKQTETGNEMGNQGNRKVVEGQTEKALENGVGLCASAIKEKHLLTPP